MASSVDDTTESLIYSHQSEIYRRLRDGEIRLVTILRGQWSDQIHCQLHCVFLSDLPKYKALSYAWGSPRVTEPIFVNGCRYPVTFNLEAALRRIRRSDSDLIIWIDALCINQSNVSERTEQVKLMHDIFASTEEVIAYLGEAPCYNSKSMSKQVPTCTTIFNLDDSDEDKLDVFRLRCVANEGLDTLRDKATKDYAFDVLCFLRRLSEKYDMNRLPMFDSTFRQFIDSKYQRNLFEGLRQLMLSRWWNRIWVIQEIVVPRTVIIVYGSTMAPWKLFVEAAYWESRNRYSSNPIFFPREYSIILAHFSRIILDIEGMRNIWRRNERSTLLPLLRQFSGRKASDDRDKVFALLSLAGSQTSIVPNYSLSVPSVFQATVFDIIKKTKSLAALTGDLGRKDRQDLPSWVPDWSAKYNNLDRRRSDNTEKYNATNGCQIYVQDEADEELDGICQYLGIIKEQFKERTIQEQMRTLHEIVRTSDWTKFLPTIYPDKLSADICLTAVEKFYTARGLAVCLKTHCDEVIGLRGLRVDQIAVTGEIAFSEDEVWSILHSWAFLVVDYFRKKPYDSTKTGLGDAFRRTLCGDIMNNTRGLRQHDHIQIALWFFRRDKNKIGLRDAWTFKEAETATKGWSELFKDLDKLTDYLLVDRSPTPPSIRDAVQSAALQRTFFITQQGFIGLGPAKMRPGDSLYILMGGHSPFILRRSGSYQVPGVSQRFERRCFEVIGDCYAHGLMDGEIMGEWLEALHTDSVEVILADFWKSKEMILQEREKCCTYLLDLEKIPNKCSMDYERILNKIRYWISLARIQGDKEGQWIVQNMFSASKDFFNELSDGGGGENYDDTSFILEMVETIKKQLRSAELRVKHKIDDLEDRMKKLLLEAEETHIYLV